MSRWGANWDAMTPWDRRWKPWLSAPVTFGADEFCDDTFGADIGSDVAAKLKELGYATVADFQRAKGLAADGVAGHDTLMAMGLGNLFKLNLSSGQTQLDTKNTPLTPEQAAQALSAGYQTVTGVAPTPAILALLIAQSGHETANWQKLPNYNFGGIKMTPGNKYVQAFITPEGKPPNQKLYVLGFAAYPSAAEGAAAYIRTLKARTNWWNGLQSGTPEGLIAGLTVQPYAYFTGSSTDYLASVRNRAAQFANLAQQYARQLSAEEMAAAHTVAASTASDIVDATKGPVLGGLLGGALGTITVGTPIGAIVGAGLGAAFGLVAGVKLLKRLAAFRHATPPTLTVENVAARLAPPVTASAPVSSMVVQAAAALAVADPCLKKNESLVRSFQSAAGLGVDGRYSSDVAVALKRYRPNAPAPCSPRPAWWGPAGSSFNS